MTKGTSPQNKIRVLIVDDSAVYRGAWARILNEEADMQVVTAAIDGLSGVESLRFYDVDVVILDFEMPRLNGLATIPLMLNVRPGIKFVITTEPNTPLSRAGLDSAYAAVSEYLVKPAGFGDSAEIKSKSRELVHKIRSLMRTNPAPEKNTSRASSSASFTPSPVPIPTPVISGHPAARPAPQGGKRPRLVVIGASTGGPAALNRLFKRLSRNLKLPILVVQHMPPTFTSLLATQLAQDSGRPCHEATDRMKIENQHIYLAPGDYHMVIEGSASDMNIRLNQQPTENFCRPAVDPLFRSAAKTCKDELLAVVLTGMGEDGRLGCEEVVRAGGTVIVQDEASSVVWGMPGAIARRGLASAILPLDEIAVYIETFCSTEAK